jgi:hypothetical protein
VAISTTNDHAKLLPLLPNLQVSDSAAAPIIAISLQSVHDA